MGLWIFQITLKTRTVCTFLIVPHRVVQCGLHSAPVSVQVVLITTLIHTQAHTHSEVDCLLIVQAGIAYIADAA